MIKSFRNYILRVLFFLNLVTVAYSYDLSFKLTSSVAFPFLSAGETKYESAGAGEFFNAGVTILDSISAGPELGYVFLPIYNSEKLESDRDASVSIFPFGIHLNTCFYPFSRFEVSAGLSAGAWIGMVNDHSLMAPWYRAYGEIGFRLNPFWSIGINGSWFDCQSTSYFGNPGAAGLTAGVYAKFKFDIEKSSGSVMGSVSQDDGVFPVFYSLYKDNPLGSIEIINNETAEIKNVSVKFRSENYTASDMYCGSINVIKKRKKADVLLYADFADSILRFTEEGKITGELVVDYELLGEKRESVIQVVIPVYNRNQIRWADASALSGFVAYNGNDVLEVSKNLVGVSRSHLRSGLNNNLQFAMYLFEGIKLAGIEYTVDESTPYNDFHLDGNLIDYIQYPYQTMQYKSGDKDDLGILYMALLSSVGINAAYIPLEDEFIVAIDTGINASKAGNFFDGYDRIIVYDDSVWIPVAMSSINEGFVNCWYKGVVEIQNLIMVEEDVALFTLSDCWQFYPPASVTTADSIDFKINEANLISTVENDISRYITAEFGPQIAAVQNRIKAEGASVSLYNKLGMLYVRAGMYSSAIPVYELSAKMGSVAAMNNLGNIASIQKREEDAKSWYRKVLEIEPDNATALKNLQRLDSD